MLSHNEGQKRARTGERQSGCGGSYCTNPNVCLQFTLKEKKKKRKREVFIQWWILIVHSHLQNGNAMHSCFFKHTSTHTQSCTAAAAAADIAVESQNNS